MIMKNCKRAAYYAVTAVEAFLAICAILIALLNASMFIQSKVFLKPVPTVFGYSYANVLSGSMEPLVSAGDLVVCKEQDEYSVNNVVLFEDEGYVILHRIVGEEDGAFITQGDANNVPDEARIQPEDIHGILVCSFKGLGSQMAHLSTGIGALWFIATSLLMFLALDFARDALREFAAKEIAAGKEDEDENSQNENICENAFGAESGKNERDEDAGDGV